MLVRIRMSLTAAVLAGVSLAVPAAPVAQGPAGPLSIAAGETGASADLAVIRDWDARLARMSRGGDLQVNRVDADGLVAGREHERLDQYHGGVRVFGGEVVRQLDRGQTVSVFGRLYDGIVLDTEPVLSAAEAVRIVEARTGVAPGAGAPPELVVLPLDEGGYALAYRARVMTADNLLVLFVDARSGAVALEYSDLQTAIGMGKGVHGDTKKLSTRDAQGRFVAADDLRPARIHTFDMKGDLQRTLRFLNNEITLSDNDLSTDTDNDWDDAATVDGHAYAGWTYDYLYKRFNRLGLNGSNLRMVNLVHPVKREDVLSQPSSVVGLFYLNAFYAGNGVMVYGEGLPTNLTAGGYKWNYFSGALDVVAHELAHGVTDYTSRLIYRNESGALNEAFSDIIGASVEFYFQQAGAGYLNADYAIGEDLTAPISGFRSMSNPQVYGHPDHYSRRYLGTSDNGGVHSNSGIANHAFYLAIEGGTNRTSGLTVQGVGSANRERIEKTFYRAFTQMLPANATFAIARSATLQAARDLYGAGSDVERAVGQAWTACGVN
jgi:thermolysin